MTLRADYDAWHRKYHELDTSYDDTSSPWYQWVAESIGNVSGLRLEVACGRGGFVTKLARSAVFACGVDVSFTAVSIGKQRWQAADPGLPAGFVQGDAYALPSPKTSSMFSSLAKRLNICRIQCEDFMNSTGLPPAGDAFPHHSELLLKFMGLYEIYARFCHPHRTPDQTYDRVQVFSQTRQLLRSAGWKIIRSDGTVHQFPFFPGRNPIRVRAFESVPRLRKLISIFAFTYCLVAQKKES